MRQKVLHETHNYGLDGGEDSGTSEKETKQKRQVGEGGEKIGDKLSRAPLQFFVRRKGCSLVD